jgi:hypothetical protein
MRAWAKTAIILIMMSVLLFLQNELDARRTDCSVMKERLPNPQALRILSLGHEEVVADYYWFKTVLYAGGETTDKDYGYFSSLVDLVTSLDPQFEYPYLFGSVILSLEANDHEASDRLLLKGYAHHQNSWRFPFGLGYNSYFYHGDPVKAARYLVLAAKLPRRPAYLPILASRVCNEAGNTEVAIRFLETIIEETPEGKQRERLEQRLGALRVINYLESVVREYTRERGRSPGDMGELIRAGYLKRIPDDPYGGTFYLDDKGHVLTTSELRSAAYGIEKGEKND